MLKYKTHLVIIVIASVLVFAVINMDRNGSFYRGLSKVIYPITLQWVNTPEKRLPSAFHSDLTKKMNDWEWLKSYLVDYRFDQSGLTMMVQQEAVWWRNNSATGLFHLVDGDIDFQVSVKTRKESDNSSYPDNGYQFGGIILRNPSSNAIFSAENYVFNVIGYRGSRLQVETKSTENGYSKVVAKDWLSGDAELKITRHGSRIGMYARELDSPVWIEIDSLIRDDLPDTLELGLIVYSTSVGQQGTDIAINFKNLMVDQK